MTFHPLPSGAHHGSRHHAESEAPARALRIAFVSDTYAPQTNGVARTLERTVAALRSRGHEIRVLTPDDPAASSNPIVEGFPSRAFWAYPQLRMCRPMIRAVTRSLALWRADLVHVAT